MTAEKEKVEETVIGRGTQVDGFFDIDHPVRVDGKLSGRLRTSGTLIVSEDGFVEAEEIEVEEAVIRGCVEGTVAARQSVRLTSTSRFRGSLRTPHLVIEEGAQVDYSFSEESGKAETPTSTEGHES